MKLPKAFDHRLQRLIRILQVPAFFGKLYGWIAKLFDEF